MYPFLDKPRVKRRFKTVEHFSVNRKVIELQFCAPMKNYKN